MKVIADANVLLRLVVPGDARQQKLAIETLQGGGDPGEPGGARMPRRSRLARSRTLSPPRGQMNEAIEEKRGLGAYLERGREWLQEMGQRGRDQAGHEQDEPDIGFGR